MVPRNLTEIASGG